MTDATYFTVISIGCFIVLGILSSAMYADWLYLRRKKRWQAEEQKRREEDERTFQEELRKVGKQK